MRQIHRKVTIELYQSVAGLIISYEYVRGRNAKCFLSFPFLSFSLVRVLQPRRSAPQERDNVTAARDCGRVTAIIYSRLATRLRSLAIILYIHLFTITRVHVCNCIPLNTIRMPIRPNAGVRALTQADNTLNLLQLRPWNNLCASTIWTVVGIVANRTSPLVGSI